MIEEKKKSHYSFVTFSKGNTCIFVVLSLVLFITFSYRWQILYILIYHLYDSSIDLTYNTNKCVFHMHFNNAMH